MNEVYMNQNDFEFEKFLKEFVPKVENKEIQLGKALWILETTGSKDAAFLFASLDNEMKLIFTDEKVYEKLLGFEKKDLENALLKRQLDILIKEFKANMIPKKLLKQISFKEANLNQTYANFRTEIDNKTVSENEIRELLQNEKSIDLRKKAWNASKEIGVILAPQILELVKLRNEVAKHLGYDNYFEMTLDLCDINKDKLKQTFDELKNQTEETYNKILFDVNDTLSKRFNVDPKDIGPWAFKDPFCQSDPIESDHLNSIINDIDILATAKSFYEKMGFDIDDLIARSDLYEREGKNQHAFCVSIDRKKDVRTLNNIKPNAQWLETLLHEFGHAVYDLGINENLPWLLRSHPHVLTTEAIALLMGRQVYTKNFLKDFLGITDENILSEIDAGLKRRQLFFSRSVFMITEFESKLYEDPMQDLNTLWWDLYEKYYNVPRPEDRETKADWAAKYHIGLAPVYYYSYLLGEVFASTLQKKISLLTEDNKICTEQAASFLQDKMFFLGKKHKWNDLIKHVTDEKLSLDAWIEDCNK